MAKTINIPYDGREYTLEYTRASVRTMERNGFVADDISRKPMTTIPDLFAGAFIAHHPTVKRKLSDEIYDSLGDKSGLIAALAEMYNDAVETLLSGGGDDKENPGWTMRG